MRTPRRTPAAAAQSGGGVGSGASARRHLRFNNSPSASAPASRSGTGSGSGPNGNGGDAEDRKYSGARDNPVFIDDSAPQLDTSGKGDGKGDGNDSDDSNRDPDYSDGDDDRYSMGGDGSGTDSGGDESGGDDDYGASTERASRRGTRTDAAASKSVDYDSLSKRSFADAVLCRVESKGGSTVEYTRALKWRNGRNFNEAMRLAMIMDALIVHIESGKPVRRASRLTESVARSIAGVHEADRAQNWTMAEILQSDDTTESFMPYELRLKVMETANKVERVVRGADKHSKSGGYSFARNRNRSRNGRNQFFNRRSNGFNNSYGYGGSGSSGASNANTEVASNSAQRAPYRATSAQRPRFASGGGGRK